MSGYVTYTAGKCRHARAESATWRTYAAEARPLCSRYVAMACPLRLSGTPRPVGARGGGASVATVAALPEPAFCSQGVLSGRQRQSAVTRGGSGVSHLLGWSNGLIADIAMSHDLY
jgi:hypothetical protein